MPGEVKRSPMRHSEDRRWGWVCHRGEFITSLPPRIEPLPGPGTPQTHTPHGAHIAHQSATAVNIPYTCHTEDKSR